MAVCRKRSIGKVRIEGAVFIFSLAGRHVVEKRNAGERFWWVVQVILPSGAEPGAHCILMHAPVNGEM